MNYKEYQQSVGRIKFLKILGCFFIIAGIIGFFNDMIAFTKWNAKKDNYTKEYVYSEYGTLYYEKSGERVYVKDIYNTNNEKITIDIPNDETIMMYINKDNIDEGIFFDLDSSIDEGLLNPKKNIIISLFLVAIGLYPILTYKEIKENRNTTNPLLLSSIFIFLLGIGVIISQINNFISYSNLKSQNNVTTATIYSEIYTKNQAVDTYKPVAYYYVGDKKYIYVSDKYEKGTLSENLGDTFELYYDKESPNEISKKEGPINILNWIVGTLLIAISFPFIFFKRSMEKRIQVNIEEK